MGSLRWACHRFFTFGRLETIFLTSKPPARRMTHSSCGKVLARIQRLQF
jgi:hypothetical protein